VRMDYGMRVVGIHQREKCNPRLDNYPIASGTQPNRSFKIPVPAEVSGRIPKGVPNTPCDCQINLMIENLLVVAQ
jgi:hypothetical protein